jgi:hypothetical protein
MALDTLSALKASALAWIDHTNVPGATAIVDDCVALCEARVNKNPNLRLSTMETEVALTLADGKVALPSDFLAMKRVVAGYGPGGGFTTGFDAGFDIGSASDPVQIATLRLLTYAEPGWYDQAYPLIGSDVTCNFYTIVGTTLHTKASADIGIVYYAKVPPLATTDPNWLLSKAPDVYLYGTIMELLNALEGDATQKYGGLFNSAVEALIASETFSRGGTLTQRASMPAP